MQVPILRPLVDNKTGIIAPYPASNVILITDRESNVRRLLEIIVRVDKADTDDTEIIRLKNASAREVSQTLTTLIREQIYDHGCIEIDIYGRLVIGWLDRNPVELDADFCHIRDSAVAHGQV